MASIDDEWSQYLLNDEFEISNQEEEVQSNNSQDEIPQCDELYISTKTKVLFLNQEVDIKTVFWNIPIIQYSEPKEGVIKKQMKIVSKTEEEYNIVKEKLKDQYYYTENVIKQINNPEARLIKFKDERKITIGISKKDLF